MPAGFTIRSEIRVLGTIAVNRSIRELALLKRLHGPGRWRPLGRPEDLRGRSSGPTPRRKLKGEAIVELSERAAWPWATGRSSPPNCIGTKRMESAAAE